MFDNSRGCNAIIIRLKKLQIWANLGKSKDAKLKGIRLIKAMLAS